ncbi:MAG: hypothetical protein IT373_08305 [Polyangiaceae bacterium]|nr:hypothetical protein [Polyangiaceae bacterium]
MGQPVHARRGQRTNVEFAGVTIYLQLFPGIHGPDAERGIAGVPYTVTVAGQSRDGTSGADGAVPIPLPADVSECTLRVWGADYHVRVERAGDLAPPEGLTEELKFGDTDHVFRAFALGLARLGYHALGDADAGYPEKLTRELDRAVRDFQVNEAVQPYPDGNFTEPLMQVLDRRLA